MELTKEAAKHAKHRGPWGEEAQKIRSTVLREQAPKLRRRVVGLLEGVM